VVLDLPATGLRLPNNGRGSNVLVCVVEGLLTDTGLRLEPNRGGASLFVVPGALPDISSVPALVEASFFIGDSGDGV
jgi:hypothetical protein